MSGPEQHIDIGGDTGPGSVAGCGDVRAGSIAGEDVVQGGSAHVTVNIGDLPDTVRALGRSVADDAEDCPKHLAMMSQQIIAIADGLFDIGRQGEVTRVTLCQLEAITGRLVEAIYGNDGEGLKAIVLQNKEAIRLHVEDRNRRLAEMDARITHRLNTMRLMLFGLGAAVIAVVVMLLLQI